MPTLPDDITWTLITTEDWGGGLERTYRAENVQHNGCDGDVLLIHLHDEMGALTGSHSRCAKCSEDLTARGPAPTPRKRRSTCSSPSSSKTPPTDRSPRPRTEIDMADAITLDCSSVELDNGETLRALDVGNFVELDADTGHGGTWAVIEFHGSSRDRVTLRRSA